VLAVRLRGADNLTSEKNARHTSFLTTALPGGVLRLPLRSIANDGRGVFEKGARLSGKRRVKEKVMSVATHRAALVVLSAFLAAVLFNVSAPVLHGQGTVATEGFTDSATSAGLRPLMSRAEMQTFLPARGPFRFPSPYSTQGIRITTASDCGNADCVQPVGYSYWSNINNHSGSDTMLIFVGLDRRKGGAGPTLFSVSKSTGETKNLGPIFPADSPHSWSTAEGWYFSATHPTMLYLFEGSQLLRYDVQTRQLTTVFDSAGQFGADKYIWQLHSSNDDRVHSATLRSRTTYEMLGCVAYSEASGKATFVPKKGSFDECQIDRSGRWLITKEDIDGKNGEDNRIIDLQTGAEQTLIDPNGAGGHSDVGFGYMIAEDNFNAAPGAVRRWSLGQDMQGGQPSVLRGQGEVVYRTSSWSGGVGHVSYGNARSDVPIEQQTACASNANREALPRINEIVCFKLDGSLVTQIVAPNLTDLNAPGGGPDDYAKLPKGNVDVTGEYFIWTANAGTNRLDAYLVRIPRMDGSPSTAPAPGPEPIATPSPLPAPFPEPTPTPAPAPVAPSSVRVTWTSLVNATASDDSLRKTGGCAGCSDAGALSTQKISSGDGFMSFETSDTRTLRFIGLSSGNPGTDPREIAFGIRLQAGTAEVREAGLYKAEVPFGAGDTLKVAVQGGLVSYSRNGTVFYTSEARPSYPLVVDTSLLDLDATLSAVMIAGR
jgi:hypothetical protein